MWEDGRPLQAELGTAIQGRATGVPVALPPTLHVEVIGMVVGVNGQVQWLAPTDAVSNTSLRADGGGCRVRGQS